MVANYMDFEDVPERYQSRVESAFQMKQESMEHERLSKVLKEAAAIPLMEVAEALHCDGIRHARYGTLSRRDGSSVSCDWNALRDFLLKHGMPAGIVADALETAKRVTKYTAVFFTPKKEKE